MSRIRTPLYYAMINDHLDACRLLLKNGATSVDGCNVLLYALNLNKWDMAEFLMSQGIVLKSECEYNVAMISAVNGDCASMVKLIAKDAYNDGFNDWSFLISHPLPIPNNMRKLLLDISKSHQ
jgi:ankyrin repeat protein